MRILMSILLAVGVILSSYAGGPLPAGANKQCQKGEKKSTYKFKRQTHLRKVVNANPQHAGYPKADKKGNFPERIDENVYYIEE